MNVVEHLREREGQSGVVAVHPHELPDALGVRQALLAQHAWRVLPVSERLARLGRWERAIRQDEATFIERLAQATNTSRAAILEHEWQPFLRALESLRESILKSTHATFAAASDRVSHVAIPLGIVAHEPGDSFAAPLYELFVALLMGNAVVSLKPGTFAAAWSVARRHFDRSGLPHDLWRCDSSEADRWMFAPEIPAPGLNGTGALLVLRGASSHVVNSFARFRQLQLELKQRWPISHVIAHPPLDAMNLSADGLVQHMVQSTQEAIERVHEIGRVAVVYVLAGRMSDAEGLASRLDVPVVALDTSPLADVTILARMPTTTRRYCASKVTIRRGVSERVTTQLIEAASAVRDRFVAKHARGRCTSR